MRNFPAHGAVRFAALLALSLPALLAQATSTYTFQPYYHGAPLTQALAAQAGVPVDVDVYLREVADKGQSELVANNGLGTAGVQVQNALASPPAGAAAIVADAFSVNPAFGNTDPMFTFVQLEAGVLTAEEAVAVDGGPVPAIYVGGDTAHDIYDVFLGTLHLQAGEAVTTFSISVPNPDFDMTFYGPPGDPITSVAPATFEVAPAGGSVPEPASLALLVLGGGLLFRRRR